MMVKVTDDEIGPALAQDEVIGMVDGQVPVESGVEITVLHVELSQ
jgi:hypothetical protein